MDWGATGRGNASGSERRDETGGGGGVKGGIRASERIRRCGGDEMISLRPWFEVVNSSAREKIRKERGRKEGRRKGGRGNEP
jgi:hypothetical protein